MHGKEERAETDARCEKESDEDRGDEHDRGAAGVEIRRRGVIELRAEKNPGGEDDNADQLTAAPAPGELRELHHTQPVPGQRLTRKSGVRLEASGAWGPDA